MPTSPANPINPFDNTKDQYQIDLIKKVLDPTNPYAAYNNTDRFLNASYRLFTTGTLKKVIDRLAVPGVYVPGMGNVPISDDNVNLLNFAGQQAHREFKQFKGKINFQYEARTNVVSQYFWGSTALWGFGASFNNSMLASASIDLYPLGALTVIRQGINMALETTLMIANGWRYGPKMSPPRSFEPENFEIDYGQGVRTFEQRYGGGVALLGTRAAGAGVGHVQSIVNPAGWDAAALEGALKSMMYWQYVRGFTVGGFSVLDTHDEMDLIDQQFTDYLDSQTRARHLADDAAEAHAQAATDAKDASGKAVEGKTATEVARLKGIALASRNEAKLKAIVAAMAASDAAVDGTTVTHSLQTFHGNVARGFSHDEDFVHAAENIYRITQDAAEITVQARDQATAQKALDELSFTQGAWEYKEARRKLFRSKLGTLTSAGFALNALIAVGISGKMIQRASDTYYTEEEGGETRRDAAIASAVFSLLGSGSNSLANAFKSASSFATVRNWSQGTQNGLGWVGSVFGMANSIFNIAVLAPPLSRGDLSNDAKGVIAAEMGVQLLGGMGMAASNVWLGRNVIKAVGAMRYLPASAMGLSAMTVSISPLEIYALVQQGDYANKLDELGKELGKFGYAGDSQLADLYRKKNDVEGGILVASMGLALFGSIVAVAAMASVIGAPVAAIVGLVVGIADAAIRGAQQGFIENEAQKFADKIKATKNDQGNVVGAVGYFARNLTAQYDRMVAEQNTVAYLRELQANYGVDSVAGITTIQMTRQAMEMAAITRLTEGLKTSQAFVDRFVQGQRLTTSR